jgi:hypothetical protein
MLISKVCYIKIEFQCSYLFPSLTNMDVIKGLNDVWLSFIPSRQLLLNKINTFNY